MVADHLLSSPQHLPGCFCMLPKRDCSGGAGSRRDAGHGTSSGSGSTWPRMCLWWAVSSVGLSRTGRCWVSRSCPPWWVRAFSFCTPGQGLKPCADVLGLHPWDTAQGPSPWCLSQQAGSCQTPTLAFGRGRWPPRRWR